MNRGAFQSLARLRLREARALRNRRLWDGCYYLSGCAVENALKACIARSTRRYDFPDKELVNQSYTHNLTNLLRLAQLEAALENDAKTQPALGAKWATVTRWKIEARYNQGATAQEALDLYRAANGVVAWLRHHW